MVPSAVGRLAARFNEDKTHVVTLAEGFDFLGFTVRRQFGKLLIKPSKAKHRAPPGGSGGNIRNGTLAKAVLTDAAGQVEIAVPRDRAGTFEPVIVAMRQRRLTDVDAVAISLYAKGLTTGEISAHFAEVYGASISKYTISRITNAVVEEMQAWCSRSLLAVYAAVFIDAIEVDLNGRLDVLGLWAGQGGGESAKFWMSVLTDLKNRGVRDIFFVVCDGLKGLPDSVNAVFPAAIVQACVIHLIRATLRYASRRYWDQLAGDLRRIYSASTVEADWAAFEELEEKWGKPYPAIPKLWRQRGKSSRPSSPTMSRSNDCCSPPMRLSPSTPATGEPSRSRATSRPSRPRSRPCTWSPEEWTPKAPDRHDGPYGGGQP